MLMSEGTLRGLLICYMKEIIVQIYSHSLQQFIIKIRVIIKKYWIGVHIIFLKQ